jgi:hypothetical protein
VQGLSELRGRQSSFPFDGLAVRSLFISFSPVSEEGVSKALGIDKLPGPGEIAISDYVHKKSGLSKGDKIVVNGRELTVVNELKIKSPPFGSFSVVNFDDANTLFDMGGDFTYLLVLAQDQANVDEMVANIHANACANIHLNTAADHVSARGRSRSIRGEIRHEVECDGHNHHP